MKLYADYRKWNTEKVIAPEGIIVGSDQAQEWLLPWWWKHYHKFNSYPVTFIDLGMTEEMQEWCKARGTYIRLSVADIFVAYKQEIESSLVRHWESSYGTLLWDYRNAWFKKPLACLQSRYAKSIWIDLDCEIRGSVKEIFGMCSKIVIAREEMGGYNSGVVAFQRGDLLIEAWADQAMKQNHEFAGDQDALSSLINEDTIIELPSIYNWSRRSGENRDAIILHWHGRYGKTVIAHQMTQEA